jgi:hypothetical protein
VHLPAALSPGPEAGDIKLAQLTFVWQLDVMAEITVVSPHAPPFHKVLADDFAFHVRLLVGFVVVAPLVAPTTIAHVIVLEVIILHSALVHPSLAATLTQAAAHTFPLALRTPAKAQT